MKNNIISRLLMAIGGLVYLVGIWRTCPQFSDKGYFLGVLVMGIFAMLAHQRTMQEERKKDDGFASLCRLVLLLSVGLLMVGAWFVPTGWDEKIIYVAAWFVCLYGASTLPRKTVSKHMAQQDSAE
ncbi:putative membrane protein YiaA [Klebsiella oxytoca]|uniref:Putative membrane protein YiaA n=1 Tax=Klebsiella oxytoca TaxID=571 RepID=A0A318FGN6_KLEOX|nr:inner membrane protein YiaB [Klebsiella oxytoca]PXW40024.1 putative membrane protein YiaA [Klebsiella oxytoca]HCB1498463.1 hypothetical protein [Klebsiella michiganensis]HCB1845328.1 hypothetical protein [Klebsiella oxytoca]